MAELGSIVQDALCVLPKYKGCKFSIGETYESLNWDESNSVPKPTEDQLRVDMQDYVRNRKKYDYQRLRAAEYPDDKVLLKALWNAVANGDNKSLLELKSQIEAIDAKYPKEDANG